MRALAAVVVVTVAMTATGCAARRAAPVVPPTDWNAVRALAPGTPVRVNLRWSESVRGVMLAADDREIRIKRRTVFGARHRTLERQQVTAVFHRGERRTSRGAAVGALVGLGSGVMVAVSQGSVDAFALTAAAWYTAWGAGLGALAGYETREEALIYAAPATRPRQP